MEGKVTLRNYRCFTWDSPAHIEFRSGFHAYVGANNSGKSAILRSLYELRPFFSSIAASCTPAGEFSRHYGLNSISDPVELVNKDDPSRFHLEIAIDESARPKAPDQLLVVSITHRFDPANSTFSLIAVIAVDTNGSRFTFDEEKIRGSSRAISATLIAYQRGFTLDYESIDEFGKTLAQVKYFPAFRNAINAGAASYYDLPTGTALVQAWDSWKSGKIKNNQIATGHVEKQIARLLGFQSLQINADQEKVTLNVIIDGHPYKLYEVGSGIAQLIIILAGALIYKPPYILIDEPELNLHPALQLELLTTIATYAQTGIIFATHSLGLARSSARGITVVRKNPRGNATVHPLGSHPTSLPEWLGELSYSSRVELGCNGIILVEGPTEVLCLQQLLRTLGKDQKYVLMSLGGSSLINEGIAVHISELLRIANADSIVAVIDSERTSFDEEIAKDRSAFIAECGKLGVRTHITERRATENYFTDTAIKMALGDGYQALEPYQKLKDANKSWKKSDNWKIAREMSEAEIISTDLGSFLSSL